MKILIDNIIFAWQKSGGISVVWHELIKRMLTYASLKDKFAFIQYKGAEQNIFWNQLDFSDTQTAKHETHKGFLLYRYLPVFIKSKTPFIFHSTYYRVCANKHAINVVTVHDFTYEKYFKGIRRWIHTRYKAYALRKADYIICISENTKSDLLHEYPTIPKEKIHVIYNGVSEDFSVIPEKAEDNQSCHSDDMPYLLFVGNRIHYKNFFLAVKVAAQAGFCLKIVGNPLIYEEKQKVEQLLGNHYQELGYLGNRELNLAYNQAFALIYPSSYEGFGIPILEAQRAGCPVLAMNNSSIREIIGNKEQLIPHAEVADFLKQIDKLRNPDYRRMKIKEGLLNAENYSWEKTFKQYIALYQHIAEDKGLSF